MEGYMVLRRRFSPEFKAEAVRLAAQPGVAIKTVAIDLGINESVLRRWAKVAHSGGSAKPVAQESSELAKEVARLRKENARLKMERDIVKKALGYFAKDPQ
jgi:transposase